MTSVNASTDNAAPRWLLPLVLTLHAAAAAALLSSSASLVKPALRSMEIALLAPPVAATARPAAHPPVARTQAERRPQAVAPSPVPAPTSAVATPPAAAASETAKPTAAESRPAPAAEAPVAPPRFDAAYLDNPRPPYPPVARRMGEEGKTVLRVFVSAEGLPERIELSQSAGSPRLDEAALAAVRRWRFVPARQGERAVAAWVFVPLVFKLEN